MNRKLVAMLLCLTMILTSVSVVSAASSSGNAASSFTDVGTGELAMATAVLQGMDVVSGTSATSFNPGGTLTRAEACTMLVKMMGLDSNLTSGAKKTYFSDVPTSAWYAPYVNIAYSNGLVNGYGNGKFGPLDSVTYGQLATILLRMLGYQSSDVGYVWPADYTALCKDLQISHDFTIGDSTALTRGQAALMLYRSLTCKTRDGRQYYYQSVANVASTKEVLVMNVNTEHNGNTGMLLAYAMDQTSGMSSDKTSGKGYYAQADMQSAFIEGFCGQLLLDSSDRVVGFLPSESSYIDGVVSSASLSALVTSKAKYRIPSAAVVLSSDQTYTWSSGGYLHTAAHQGESVRIYFDADGTVTYIFIGTAAATSTAAAAATAEKSGSMGNYTRYADYRVTGYIESASPSLAAADSITVAGCSFEVSDDAVDGLAACKIGGKVTLLLSDDKKVVGTETASCEMVGVLASDGKSVTLCGSGLRLSATEIKYAKELAGSLVRVTASSYGTLTCTSLDSKAVSGDLDLTAGTVGSTALSPACAIYEWVGEGYVYSLDGTRGESSADFGAITWTDTIGAAQISWCHVDSNGLIDILLLKNVTGNCCSFGYLEYYTGNNGINLGSGQLSAYNNAAMLTNGSEKGSKCLCICSNTSGYVAVGYGAYGNYGEIVSVEKLSKTSVTGLGACSVGEDAYGETIWLVSDGTNTYQVSDSVEVYNDTTDSWSSGISAFMSCLDSGATLTLYYDRTAATGGQIRVAVM